ncbi:MAG: hypothetical protein IT438_13305 [Phycisphaerales bacterium]|nr:hypothetical protein [Phycisphaerales bacterium]
MHFFEDKFAALGRSIDRVLDRAKDRSPRRYRVRTGPTLRERWRESRERAVDRWKRKRWVHWRDWEPEQRRRFLSLAAVFGATALVGVGFWVHRNHGGAPSLQELMDQATVRARMEMERTDRSSPFMGWGEKKH